MISELWIENVRSLASRELKFSPGINVVGGSNGCGKTTVLESVHLLSQGFSFRARDLKEMISWNADEFILRGNFEDAGRSTARGIRVGRKAFDVRENGESLKSVAALFGNLPAVVMQPSDIELLRGAPDVRRRWLDEILCFRSAANAKTLRNYRRILQQRNQWLRQFKREGAATGGEELFQVLTDQLADLGAKLWAARIELSKEISPIITGYYRKLSNGIDEITCAYKSFILKELDALDGAEFLDDFGLDQAACLTSGSTDCLASDSGELSDGSVDENALREAYRRKLLGLECAEKIQGITLSGPHKDDLGVRIGDVEMRSSGSQGQCRSAAIAMRFAAVEVASRYLEKPILLLDDIFAELDLNRRNAVADLIRDKECQVIIATPQSEELPFKADMTVKL